MCFNIFFLYCLLAYFDKQILIHLPIWPSSPAAAPLPSLATAGVFVTISAHVQSFHPHPFFLQNEEYFAQLEADIVASKEAALDGLDSESVMTETSLHLEDSLVGKCTSDWQHISKECACLSYQ